MTIVHDDTRNFVVFLAQPDLLRPASACPTRSSPSLTVKETREQLYTLGILLLELFFGASLETQPRRKTFLGPDGKPNEFTEGSTAYELLNQVELECGDILRWAIDRCLYCDFRPDPDPSDPKFVQAVLELVVIPIKQF